MVHGSGANDRDQTLHLTGGNSLCLFPGIYNDTVRNFRDFAAAFQAAGYASIRYDKRSFTYGPQLDPLTISPYDFADDVHAVIDYAKTIPNLDANCIILLGHSQGANIVPIVAQARNDIASLLALGTGVQGIDTAYSGQVRELFYRCTRDTVTGDMNYNQLMASFQQIRNGSWNPNTPFQGAFPKFWREWMNMTDSAIYHFNQLTQPILFLHATNDFNITIENAQRIEREVTIDDAKMVYMSGLNHYFTNSASPLVTQATMDSMITWLNLLKSPNSIAEEAFSEKIKVQIEGNEIRIVSKDAHVFERISLTDLQGRTVRHASLGRQTDYAIDTTHLAAGVYVVLVVMDGKAFHTKINLHP